MSTPLSGAAGAGAMSLGMQLFESSADCVKLLDGNGCVVAMNRNGQALMEIDAFATVAGAHWTTFWPAGSHGTVERALADAAASGNATFSAPCPTAKGTVKWWDVVLTAVQGADGRAANFLAVSRDITASRQAQLELQASEARFRSLVTATSAIVWTCSAEGVFATEQAAWSAFTGQALSEYGGAGWLDAVHPDDRARTQAAWSQATENGAIYRIAHRLRDAAGQYHHMEVKAVPVSAPGSAVLEWVGTHTDTTHAIEAAAEREQLLRQVQAANDRMNDIFRQAPAFMCVLAGPEHRFELTNDRYLQLVGNRDLIGQPVRAALPEIDGQGFFELLDRVYRTGETFFGSDMPVMLQRAPGAVLEERFIDLVYMALRDVDGNVTGLLAHGVDQTHRKLAELALHASRERFEKIVSQAATGVVEMDIDGTIRFANQKYCDMLGYAHDELIGMSAADVTAPDSLAQTLAATARLVGDGAGFVIDKHYLSKAGALVPATSSVNLLRGQEGEAEGMVAIVLDTAASERASAELRASEARYRTLFESMDQGFCVIEVLFDEHNVPVDYRFDEMNGMFEQHTGISGAVGKTARELVPGIDRFWIDTYGRVAQTGEAIRFESEAAAMGRWFDVYATPVGSGARNKVALLFSDITARKASGATLRKLADDLAESDRRKTEFLATLAHELRNPLAPIRSGLAVMRLRGDDPASVAKVRDMMDRQVNHMVHLIDDLLDIARINGNKLALRKTRVDLKIVIASAVETTLPLIEAGRHQLAIDFPDAELEVDIDATRIAQVVANLLNNAAKYTPAGGRIRLAVAVQDTQVVITVADNGLGIAPDAIGGVFEMFSQVGRNLDRAQGGLGIGLSLVRRLVEMHGGSVAACSGGIDAGSTFTIRLPYQPHQLHVHDRPAMPALPASDAHAASARGVDVLIVDDNTDAASTLSMLLDLLGHATAVAHTGAAAIALVQASLPRIVFLDIGMPGMNGYDTARALRALPGGERIVLVALTGWGSETDRAHSRAAGFDHHLTKPVQLTDVEAILATL
jgi:PAS domain S-box-containing protein